MESAVLRGDMSTMSRTLSQGIYVRNSEHQWTQHAILVLTRELDSSTIHSIEKVYQDQLR